jgi:hypothetical protein
MKITKSLTGKINSTFKVRFCAVSKSEKDHNEDRYDLIKLVENVFEQSESDDSNCIGKKFLAFSRFNGGFLFDVFLKKYEGQTSHLSDNGLKVKNGCLGSSDGIFTYGLGLVEVKLCEITSTQHSSSFKLVLKHLEWEV